MDMDEVRAVAQAIADAHWGRPGANCQGHIDSAKSLIAGIDALMALRGAATMKSLKATPKATVEPAAIVMPVAPVAALGIGGADDPLPPPEPPPANVTPIKKKGKK